MVIRDMQSVLVKAGLSDNSAGRIASLMKSAGSEWVKARFAIPARWIAEELRLAGACEDCKHIAEETVLECVSVLHWEPAPQPPAPPTHGPGTELSRLLKRIGIEPTPTCQCRAMQQKMDQWGCDECSQPERIDEVVVVMREEATARGLPFLDVAGRMLVRRAIRNARRNA
jgi:hypothetical protein